jgi:hypothetical protein
MSCGSKRCLGQLKFAQRDGALRGKAGRRNHAEQHRDGPSASADGTKDQQRNCASMKMVKAIRKQAMAAERAAAQTADSLVANEMKTLATAFRAQAEVLKKKKKKKKNELHR